MWRNARTTKPLGTNTFLSTFHHFGAGKTTHVVWNFLTLFSSSVFTPLLCEKRRKEEERRRRSHWIQLKSNNSQLSSTLAVNHLPFSLLLVWPMLTSIFGAGLAHGMKTCLLCFLGRSIFYWLSTQHSHIFFLYKKSVIYFISCCCCCWVFIVQGENQLKLFPFLCFLRFKNFHVCRNKVGGRNRKGCENPIRDTTCTEHCSKNIFMDTRTQ